MNGPHLTFFPQFCPEPINDAAWYPGFNDWDLVRKLPEQMRDRFRAASGYYDLSRPQDIAAQFSAVAASPWPAMALYQYFFDGRFALQEVEKFILATKTSVPPFFTIWANESWSKRWIGKPQEIIIRQRHSLDDRTIGAHVERQCALFAHPAYRRWNDRPVFVLYSAYDVPELPRLITTYRAAFRRNGFDPAFGFCAPYVNPNFSAAEFDFCLEFQPRLFFNVMRGRATPGATRAAHMLMRWAPSVYDSLISIRDSWARRKMTPRECFAYGDYLELVEQGVFSDLLRQAYGLPVIRCLFYSWNNFPRYRGGAVVVTHGNDDYARFEKLVEKWKSTEPWFLINSWNEWSEGAALEPGVQRPEAFDLA